jgi:L-ascorbate metabolism protein UlaG (beta-lactamase superfamily)
MKILIMVLALMSQSMASDHFDGKEFFNPWGVNNQKKLWDILSWKIKGSAAPWPDFVETDLKPIPHPTLNSYVVTWINHSTFLIQTGTLNILIDPIWGERASPVSFAGPKRVVNAGIKFSELPKIDLVLVSHNHYDHLDNKTLKELSDVHAPLILVPLGDKDWLHKSGVKNVEEMDWFQEKRVQDTIITFLPAQHWSARGLFDRNESLWGSWGINFKNTKIYHAGDTGLGPHFKQIREKWGAPQLALLPIGAYEPRWFMKEMHMNPADAIKAFKILEAESAVGMHFGTFQLTDEEYDAPAKVLEKNLKEEIIGPDQFLTPKIGESYIFHKEM